MFERRLKIVLSLPILCGIVIIARLYQLQIVQGNEYQRLADAALVSPKPGKKTASISRWIRSV